MRLTDKSLTNKKANIMNDLNTMIISEAFLDVFDYDEGVEFMNKHKERFNQKFNNPIQVKAVIYDCVFSDKSDKSYFHITYSFNEHDIPYAEKVIKFNEIKPFRGFVTSHSIKSEEHIFNHHRCTISKESEECYKVDYDDTAEIGMNNILPKHMVNLIEKEEEYLQKVKQFNSLEGQINELKAFLNI